MRKVLRLSTSIIILLSAFIFSPSRSEDLITLTGFRGLNTIDGDLVVGQSFCRMANNVMFTKDGRNAIAKRPGYKFIDSLTGCDSLVSLSVYQKNNGVKQLIVVADDKTTPDTGWGSVYLTKENKDSLASMTKIRTKWPVVNRSHFIAYQDNLIGVNGAGGGMIWNGRHAYPFPLTAPGEATIIPLKKTGGVTGEVRYIFTFGRGIAGDSTYNRASYISRPVKVVNGCVALTGFSWMPKDTFYTAPDSIAIYIYRIKQADYPLDQSDSAYYVGYIVVGTDPQNLANQVVIDSLSDAQLSASKIPAIPNGIGTFSGINGRFGAYRDSSGRYRANYGAPTFIATDTGQVYTSTDSTLVSKLRLVGYSYIYQTYDSITGLTSDSSNSLFMMRKMSGSIGSYTIGLPRIDSSRIGLTYVVYRAPVIAISYKLTFGNGQNGSIPIGGIWLRTVVDSFVVSQYKELARLTPSLSADITYRDNVKYDSTEAITSYFKTSYPPSIMEDAFVYNGKMIVRAGGNVYYSNLDSVSTYGLFDFKVFNNNDGDRVTSVWPTRTAVRVFKNRSNWNLYGSNFTPEIVGNWGCVAPESHAPGENGHFYLGSQGMYFETEGPTLERTAIQSLVSAPLSNFQNMSILTKQKAVSKFLPNERLLITCIGDTDYVYDVNAQAWSTWTDMSFQDAVLFDTGYVAQNTPGTSFYFTKPGSSKLFRWPDGTTDDNSQFIMEYQSPPLWSGFDRYNLIKLGLVTRHCVSGTDQLTLDVVNEVGDSIASKQLDSLARGYIKYEIGSSPAYSAKLTLRSITVGTAFSQGAIDAIMIERKKAEEIGGR